MKRIVLVSAILAASSVLSTSAASRQASAPPLTPEQTLDRRAIGDLEFSPDGARLAFTVTEPPKGTTRPRHVWMLDVASGHVRQLTHSDKTESGPRWAPDGRSLAFISDRDGAPGLYLLPLDGGEGTRLVDSKEAVRAFRWSPDGRQIALLMPEAKPDALDKREKEKDDARVVDKDDRLARLWVVDVSSHALRQVTSGAWEIDQFEWLPAGDRVVASATRTPESDQNTNRIYAVAIADGQFSEIAAPRGPFGGLAVSPDGASIAYVGSRVDGPEPHDLWLQPTGGGAARNLTGATVDRPLSRPEWIDGRTLMATEQRGFASALVSLGLDGRAHGLDGLRVNPSAFARASNGTIAYVGETAAEAPEVWIKTPDAPAKAATTLNATWATIAVVAPEFVHYKSFDGAEIEGALLLPGGATYGGYAGPRLPFVVLVHGGPTGRWSDAFEPWGQLLVARGYAVLYPNVRGSTGYGERFVEMQPRGLGRRRLQGRHGRRGRDGRARHRRPESTRHRRLVLRRLHVGVGGDADHAVQGRRVGRAGDRHGQRIRHRERLVVRRVVLRPAVRAAGGLHQELADHVRETREDADAPPPGRGRRDRSHRPEPAVLPRAEALRRAVGPGALPARGTRAARGETPRSIA